MGGKGGRRGGGGRGGERKGKGHEPRQYLEEVYAYGVNSKIPRAQYFIISYFSFRFTIAVLLSSA